MEECIHCICRVTARDLPKASYLTYLYFFGSIGSLFFGAALPFLMGLA